MFNLILLVAIFFANSVSAFSQTLITVVDQNDTPLANTVIEYLTADNFNQTEKSLYVMDQVNKSFLPHVLVVPKNSHVSFPNSDDIRHHVYSFSAAKTFELKLYAGKPKSPVLFETEGVVVMGCNIHDSMVGYIYVTNQKNTYLTDEKGTVLFETDLSANAQLQIWHANAKHGVDNRQLLTINKANIKNNQLKIKIDVNAPEARDSFEDVFSHAQ